MKPIKSLLILVLITFFLDACSPTSIKDTKLVSPTKTIENQPAEATTQSNTIPDTNDKYEPSGIDWFSFILNDPDIKIELSIHYQHDPIKKLSCGFQVFRNNSGTTVSFGEDSQFKVSGAIDDNLDVYMQEFIEDIKSNKGTIVSTYEELINERSYTTISYRLNSEVYSASFTSQHGYIIEFHTKENDTSTNGKCDFPGLINERAAYDHMRDTFVFVNQDL